MSQIQFIIKANYENFEFIVCIFKFRNYFYKIFIIWGFGIMMIYNMK